MASAIYLIDEIEPTTRNGQPANGHHVAEKEATPFGGAGFQSCTMDLDNYIADFNTRIIGAYEAGAVYVY